LVRVLEVEAEHCLSHAARGPALHHIGQLYSEKLGRPEDSMRTFERGLAFGPANTRAVLEMARVYESTQQYEPLVSLLATLVDKVGDSGRTGLMHRVGQIYEEKLGQIEEATRWYEASVSTEPSYLPAFQALLRIYSHRNDWEGLLRIHLAVVDHID